MRSLSFIHALFLILAIAHSNVFLLDYGKLITPCQSWCSLAAWYCKSDLFISGLTWLYKSSVIVIELWPNRSCTNSGGHRAVIVRLRVHVGGHQFYFGTPAFSSRFWQLFVNPSDLKKVPSSLQNTRLLS